MNLLKLNPAQQKEYSKTLEENHDKEVVLVKKGSPLSQTLVPKFIAENPGIRPLGIGFLVLWVGSDIIVVEDPRIQN